MPRERTLLRRYIDLPSDDGKRHRSTISAYSEKELEQKYREKLMELARNDFRFAKTATVENFFPHYLELCRRPNGKNGCFEDKKARMRRYLIDPLGRCDLDAVSPLMLQRILNNNCDKSQSFLDKLHGEITSFFGAAEDEGLLRKNPAKNLYTPEGECGERRALTLEERKAFLTAADQHKHGLLFLVTYYCGLRPGEVRALYPSDIDLKNKTITVRRAYEERTGKIKEPKTKSGYRKIPIPDQLLARLPKKKGTGYLFKGDQSGTVISSSTYRRAWKAILNLMDVELGAKRYRNKILPETSVLDRSITPYYLRHNYCSMLAEKGVDLKTAQAWMGHANISITANIYQHVTEITFQAGAEKVKDL